MEERGIMPAERKQRMEQEIAAALETLRLEEARRPMDFALQLGYAVYVRLFVEAQKRPGLQQYFPYGGFLMQWTEARESQESSQSVWELQYQVKYCASIVEEGHFMDKAAFTDRTDWTEQICRLVDLASDGCGWGSKEGIRESAAKEEAIIPEDFGWLLEETIRQISQMGNSGCFLLSRWLMELMAGMADIQGKKRVWNPGCRTGGFLKLLYEKNPALHLTGSEEEKDSITLARMLRFCFGGEQVELRDKDPLTETGEERFDLIFSNPPVGEVEQQWADRFPVSTRKIPLQYLQMMMNRLTPTGTAMAVVNESVLFRYDAEQKVRSRLVEEMGLLGVLSLPAGALLPYTAAKASLLIIAGEQKQEGGVWFYEVSADSQEQLKAEKAPEHRILMDGEIKEILACWRNRETLYQKWRNRLAEEPRLNKWENPAPLRWEEACWFADRETIRRNDYNLTAGRYKPWQEEEPVLEGESPSRLLLELAAMEKESAAKIQELIEMTKNYE